MGWWMVQNTIIASLLAGVVLIVIRLTRIGPAGRHVLWLVVLLKLMTPPLVVWPWPIPAIESMPSSTGSIAANSPLNRRSHSVLSEREAQPATGRGKTRRISGTSTVPPALRPTESHPSTALHDTAFSPSRTEDALPSPWNEPLHSTSGPTFPSSRPAEGARQDVVATAPATIPERSTPAVKTARTSPVADPPNGPSPSTFDRMQQAAVVLWCAGIALVAILQVFRIWRMQERIRTSHEAPAWLHEHVAQVAAQLEIPTPRTRLVASFSSPAVWAWGRAQLLWPAAFDENQPAHGRQGILLHELAHLRRRDHWVGWLDLVAGCVWWWNPLCWFVRQQLQENAELACDAWVVELLPGGRRAYAEALLTACELSSRAPAVWPAVGIGGSHRRNLERRLTMILSERVAFRASWTVLLSAIILAAVTLPGWSQSPPPKATTSSTPAEDSAPEAEVERTNDTAPAASIVPRYSDPGTPTAVPVFDEAADPSAVVVEGETEAQPNPSTGGAKTSRQRGNDVEFGAVPESKQTSAQRIRALAAQVKSMLNEIDALYKEMGLRGSRGVPDGFGDPQPLADLLDLTSALDEIETPAVAGPNVVPTYRDPSQQWTHAHIVKSETFTLTRTTYKLPPQKADALISFLNENVYLTEPLIMKKVDGESLTITTTPDVQKTLGELIHLMQRERPESEKPARPNPLSTFGRNDPFQQ